MRSHPFSPDTTLSHSFSFFLIFMFRFLKRYWYFSINPVYPNFWSFSNFHSRISECLAGLDLGPI